MAPDRPPGAVLLDALGTLIGIEPPWQRLVDLLEARHAIQITQEQAVGALRAEMSYYRTHCHQAGDPATLADLRDRCAGVVAKALGGALAGLERPALTQTLLDAIRFAAYPDAPAALGELRERGIRLVVLSNWDISLHEVLVATRLAGFLDGVVCSAEHGASKPAPEIFHAALAIAGVGAERAVHVGDSYAEDVLGARAAGIEALLLRRPPGAGGLIGSEGVAPAGDVPTIASLAELAQTLT
jgi:putative hydrolase of the HAD superfamily